MNTESRKNAKNELEKDFYKLKINSIYGKTVQNDRKHRNIKLVTTEAKRNKLASEPNYHSTKCISKHLLVMEMKKAEVKMNKPIYLGQAVLDISKTPLEIGKNKKVLDKFKDEIGGKIMTKFVALRAKTYSFLIDEYTDEDYEKDRIVKKKQPKGTKKCVVKKEILFNNYPDSLFKNKVLYRSQQRFRSDHHKVYTEEVNKIALSSNMIKEYKHK